MKLPRPYIPLYVRCQVAARQLGISPVEINEQIERARSPGRWGAMLKDALLQLAEKMDCPPERLQLDHDPALENRRQIWRFGVFIDYDPPANDPAHLIYREKEAHRVKTLIRGDGAQRSDAAQRRYLKRVEQNRNTVTVQRSDLKTIKLKRPDGRELSANDLKQGQYYTVDLSTGVTRPKCKITQRKNYRWPKRKMQWRVK